MIRELKTYVVEPKSDTETLTIQIVREEGCWHWALRGSDKRIDWPLCRSWRIFTTPDDALGDALELIRTFEGYDFGNIHLDTSDNEPSNA